MTVRLRPCGCPDNRRGYEVLEPSTEPHEPGCTRALADVPGPDDSTPTTAEKPSPTGGVYVKGDDQVEERLLRAAARFADELRDRGIGGWFQGYGELFAQVIAEIDRLRSAPAAGEGAALIAATEQEIVEGEDCIGIIQQREAWEATARRLADRVDELAGEVMRLRATIDKWAKHGYATGQLNALRDGLIARNWIPADTDEVPSALRMIDDYVALAKAQDEGLSRLRAEVAYRKAREASLEEDRNDAQQELGRLMAERDPKPAVQGAGRDWRGEIAKEMAEYAETRLGQTVVYAEMAAHLVAVLGLHDLEQAAAARDKAIEANGHAVERLMAMAAERDAARRELEQLRGEVEQAAHKLDAFSSCYFGCHKAAHANGAYLRALAAGAPATQDGDH